jgi:hypothetical protein
MARAHEQVEPVTVACQECGVDLAADSPDLRLELTCDDDPLVYALRAGSGSSASKTPSSQEGARKRASAVVRPSPLDGG